MKVILQNTNLIFAAKKGQEKYRFNISYDDIQLYNIQGDVNLIFTGDIHVGDKVTVNFEQNNTGDSLVFYTKSSSNDQYDDHVGLGALRWTGTKINTATADAECSNLKLYVLAKEGTIIEQAGKMSGEVLIERA